MANAISSCFEACGEQYSVEKIVVDPLYDPNFDRQLLGACSLDISKTEMQSLITQVKDLLAELPEPYIEVSEHKLIKFINNLDLISNYTYYILIDVSFCRPF